MTPSFRGSLCRYAVAGASCVLTSSLATIAQGQPSAIAAWRAQHEVRFAQMRAAARAGQATVTLAPIGGLVPRRVAIMGETLFYNPAPNNSVQRSNNDLTARWFGLDSVRLTARPAYEVGLGL